MHKILKCKKTVEMEKSLACLGRTEIQVPTYVQNNVQVLYKQRKLQLALTTLVSFVRKKYIYEFICMNFKSTDNCSNITKQFAY